MSVHALLLRGINVGGSGKLPMAELRAILEGLGAREVATLIQSGNAVFRAGAGAISEAAVEDAIQAARGFRPTAIVLDADTLRAGLAAFPFPEALARPRTGQAWICRDTPRAPDLDALDAVAGPGERFALRGRWFYLDAPKGIGRSKLAAKVERALGVPATARNLATLGSLVVMLPAD